MNGDAALDVVIVAYRSRELLRECLGSLRAHPPAGPMKVVVVDNASADGTPEMIASEFPEVEPIASARNLGFAAGTNLGARRGNAPYLLALNPDTAVTTGALDTVIGVLERHAEVGVVGPRLERADGSLDHAARRSFPTPLSALGHFSGLGRRAGASGPLAAYRAPEVESGPVDAVNGAFMLMRRSVFEAAGGFDEDYWMYMEDLDLSYRLAKEGWRKLVRAHRDRDARQGRHGKRGAPATPQLALPSRHVPVLPPPLRAPSLRSVQRARVHRNRREAGVRSRSGRYTPEPRPPAPAAPDRAPQ